MFGCFTAIDLIILIPKGCKRLHELKSCRTCFEEKLFSESKGMKCRSLSRIENSSCRKREACETIKDCKIGFVVVSSADFLTDTVFLSQTCWDRCRWNPRSFIHFLFCLSPVGVTGLPEPILATCERRWGNPRLIRANPNP